MQVNKLSVICFIKLTDCIHVVFRNHMLQIRPREFTESHKSLLKLLFDVVVHCNVLASIDKNASSTGSSYTFKETSIDRGYR